MAGVKFFLVSACLMVVFEEIHGHGYMWEPVGRNAAFKKGHNTPKNVQFNENFCGGAQFQAAHGGKCGACGDKVTDAIPRPHENGGKYGTGTIVEIYKEGQNITVQVILTANHLGYFTFGLCPLNGPNDVETQECFDKHPLRLTNGRLRHKVNAGDRVINVELTLPVGLTCKQCSLQWYYRGGNNWGKCKRKLYKGQDKRGCGPQEHFLNCADVTIE